MKKQLGKRANTTTHSIESYNCACNCSCADCTCTCPGDNSTVQNSNFSRNGQVFGNVAWQSQVTPGIF